MSPSNPPPTTYAIVRDAARGVLVVTAIALACALALKLCTGCSARPPADRSPALTAEQSAIAASYQAALLECLEHGKIVKRKRGPEAGFAAYAECADDVDRRFGR